MEMKLSAVIVNYNDATNTLELAKKLVTYDCVDVVIVVDNASTDIDTNILESIKAEKYKIIFNKINQGYGQGNNIGIVESMKSFGCTHCLVVNPDVEIHENTVKNMKMAFDLYPLALIIAPSTYAYGKRVAWNVKGFSDLVLSKGKIYGKVTGKPFYPNDYFKNKKYCQVDAVLGACLMVDINKFLRIGMYDQKMFLYEEENYLAIRCKQLGYQTIILCNDEYIHNHKPDNNKPLIAQLRAKKQMCDSLQYLVKTYCSYGYLKQFVTWLYLLICRLETLLSHLLRWK